MSSCSQGSCSCRLVAASAGAERSRPWLHRLAVVAAAVTFVVLVSGGNVTSRDAGLAVPDGYTVFGHVLWAFPYSQWVGNVFHEHIHRLNGSVIGMLSIVLAVCLVATEKRRRWVRLAGLVMVLMVLVQGALGAMRVNQISTALAVVHAVHGQLVFCMMVLLAAAASRYGQGMLRPVSAKVDPMLGRLSLAVWGVMVVQLILGAVVRHTGSGLAIPDFPSAYGGFVPPLTDSGVRAAIDRMPYEQVVGYYTAGQVGVHWAHRMWAVVVAGLVVWLATAVHRRAGGETALTRPAMGMMVLLVVQVALGAMVIWTGRTPDVATAHQAVGAALLGLATLLALRIHLFYRGVDVAAGLDEPKEISAVTWGATQPA